MKRPIYVSRENIGGLSLEAMGYLLLLAHGMEEESVFSSRVTIEAAKHRVRFVQQVQNGGCGQ